MSEVQTFSLDAVRTDGWFERVGQGIGSFRALCDVVGDRFFAFSMITGARITALTVDRRNPEDTMVDFVVGGDGNDLGADVQRLPLPDFRRRLVAALLTESEQHPPPVRDTDLEALQLHVGVRYLLLAPLYGYSLVRLSIEEGSSTVTALVDGHDVSFGLRAFQQRLRGHVREELNRATRGNRSTIDLGHVTEAERAAAAHDWTKIVELIGAWPAPLAIFLRTPEGQALPAETTSLIAKALGLLGQACVAMNDLGRAEEVFRLAIQYAQGGPAAPEVFVKFGESVLGVGRAGEAIGLLRRAVALGAQRSVVDPKLARAYLRRHRFVAAWSCLQSALSAGVPPDELKSDLELVERALGKPIETWRTFAPSLRARQVAS